MVEKIILVVRTTYLFIYHLEYILYRLKLRIKMLSYNTRKSPFWLFFTYIFGLLCPPSEFPPSAIKDHKIHLIGKLLGLDLSR